MININNYQGFPCGSAAKESASSAGAAGDAGSIPGWGRCPGVGNGNPLQYSCLENLMDSVLQSTGLQSVRHDWPTRHTHSTHMYVPPRLVDFTVSIFPHPPSLSLCTYYMPALFSSRKLTFTTSINHPKVKTLRIHNSPGSWLCHCRVWGKGSRQLPGFFPPVWETKQQKSVVNTEGGKKTRFFAGPWTRKYCEVYKVLALTDHTLNLEHVWSQETLERAGKRVGELAVRDQDVCGRPQVGLPGPCL